MLGEGDNEIVTVPLVTKAESEKHARTSLQKSKAGVFIMAVAVLVLAIVALVCLVPDGTAEPREPEHEGVTLTEDADTLMQAEQVASGRPKESLDKEPKEGKDNLASAPAADGASEKADFEYLNKEKTTWRRDKLKSKTGQALINAIATGNIDAFASNPYISHEGNCTNIRAKQAAKWAWTSKGTDHEKAVRELMKNSVKSDGTVDVFNLWDKISRHQPLKNQANKEPMPTI